MATRKSLLDRVLEKPNLKRAWSAVCHRKPPDACGSDGQTIQQFSVNRRQNIATISDQIRAGTYAFRPLLIHRIPKRTIGERVLKIPTIRDRLVLRAIHQRLNTHRGLRGVKNNQTNFAYRPNISMSHLVKKISALRPHYSWIMTADIEDFFDKIDHDQAISLLEQLTGDRSISTLIHDSLTVRSQALDCPVSDYGSEEDYDEKTGLPQGLAISPILSNIVLLDFDRRASRQSGFRILRYADDLIALCKSKDDAFKAHEYCERMLTGIGLSIRPLGTSSDAKASLVNRMQDGFDFVGLEYNEHSIRPSQDKLMEFERQIKTIIEDEQKSGASAIYRRIHLFTIGWFGAYGSFCDPAALRFAANRADELVLEWMHGKFKTLRMADGNGPFRGGRRRFLSPNVRRITERHIRTHRAKRWTA